MEYDYKTLPIISAIEIAARNLDLHLMLYFAVTAAATIRPPSSPSPSASSGYGRWLAGRAFCYGNALAESFNAAVKVERGYSFPENAERPMLSR